MSQTIALVVLGVIGGVPLYALIGGWAARQGIMQNHLPWEWHERQCPQWQHINRGMVCTCGAEQRAAALLWPILLAVIAAFHLVRAVLYIPARAAYRAALGPKCPGPECGGCHPYEEPRS